MAKVLVIRFSSLGDVAMTIPVVCSFAKQYPEHQVTVVSRAAMAPLFAHVPGNVSFVGADLKGRHKGPAGLNRLFSELHQEGFDYVADFHDVLRTQFLRFRFWLKGVKVAHIRKGKKGKRKLVRPKNKIMAQQPSSFHNYAQVFSRLGFPVHLNFTSIFGEQQGDFSQISQVSGEKGSNSWIGIAPFAKHKGKIYPKEWMEKVVAHLSSRGNTRIFLFGHGREEEAVINEWTQKYPNIVSTIGRLNMNTELILMSYLDVMLSMDSANMHLASLVNTPVVSIWGATHPYCGFMGWQQLPTNAVQVDLPCRPCSVFGNKECLRGDYACLNEVTPQMVVEKVEGVVVTK